MPRIHELNSGIRGIIFCLIEKEIIKRFYLANIPNSFYKHPFHK